MTYLVLFVGCTDLFNFSVAEKLETSYLEFSLVEKVLVADNVITCVFVVFFLELPQN